MKLRRGPWIDVPVLVVLALVIAYLVKTFVLQAFYIPSGSMMDTLRIGDRVLVDKLLYDVRSVRRGEIVVFVGPPDWQSEVPTAPAGGTVSRFFRDLAAAVGFGQPSETDFIKRVIGLPGDVVACDQHDQVTVDGVVLHEPYVYPGEAACGLDDPAGHWRVRVPPGRLWVMGDHREFSSDSRYHIGDAWHGTIPESAVIGRAFFVVWPPGHFGALDVPAAFARLAGAVTARAPDAVAVAVVAPGYLLVRRRRRRP
jgi:signal peptidase I